VTPLSSVKFYQAVVAADGHKPGADAPGADAPGADALARTQQFYRLFLAPGVGHCGGGPGPNQFGQAGGGGDAEHDLVAALERWVEKGVPPTRVVARKFVDDDKTKGVAMTRPLCPFPQVAHYQGTGDVKDAANFVCKAP
jgi:feruloyl esterase